MRIGYKKGMRVDPLAGRSPFIEAVPRLEILAVVGAARSGATRVHWLDQDDAVVGAADITRCSSEILAFDFFTNQIGYVQEASTCDFIRLEEKDRGGCKDSLYARCRGCNNPKDVILYHNKAWLCSRCHGIPNFSACIDVETREYLKFVELGKIAEHPRPRYMRHARYDQIVRDYQRLFKIWAPRPPRTLPAHHLQRVRACYFRPENAPGVGTDEHLHGKCLIRPI